MGFRPYLNLSRIISNYLKLSQIILFLHLMCKKMQKMQKYAKNAKRCKKCKKMQKSAKTCKKVQKTCKKVQKMQKTAKKTMQQKQNAKKCNKIQKIQKECKNNANIHDTNANKDKHMQVIMTTMNPIILQKMHDEASKSVGKGVLFEKGLVCGCGCCLFVARCWLLVC